MLSGRNIKLHIYMHLFAEWYPSWTMDGIHDDHLPKVSVASEPIGALLIWY